MKGFMHLIEVAVAGILIMIILGLFFTTQSVKLNWERTELISINSNVLHTLKASNRLPELFSDTSNVLLETNDLRPPNVEYGIRISGIPKDVISVACPTDCSSVRSILSDNVYVNGRWIGFTVNTINMGSVNLTDYDALVLYNYNQYGTYETQIRNYLSDDGTVVAIHNVTDSADSTFRSIFDLTSSAGAGTTSPNFTSYEPVNNDIAKYFLGFGFFAEASTDVGSGTKQGKLDIWGTRFNFNLTSSTLRISGQTVNEGDTFTLGGPDARTYQFRVKKIHWSLSPSAVSIQPTNTSYVFAYNMAAAYTGNNIVSVDDDASGCTANGKAIWINEYEGTGNDHDYETLIKSAIATSSTDWFIKDIRTDVERAEASIFLPMCCDMPETAKIDMVSWYSY
ncbi:MAG: hypothetical protein GOV02_02235 [Candidatus Aenigmarchaeota archaeon]|nr:hypothetical protein [Candidatus Aenigmarchaeota archaeon]